jgi:hypothetical protein
MKKCQRNFIHKDMRLNSISILPLSLSLAFTHEITWHISLSMPKKREKKTAYREMPHHTQSNSTLTRSYNSFQLRRISLSLSPQNLPITVLCLNKERTKKRESRKIFQMKKRDNVLWYIYCKIVIALNGLCNKSSCVCATQQLCRESTQKGHYTIAQHFYETSFSCISSTTQL